MRSASQTAGEEKTSSPALSVPVEFNAAFCAKRSRGYILVAAILISALGFIDGTIVSIAMPAMRDQLGASLIQAQWISNAYMIALSALILAGGALGDRFGTGRILIVGTGIFIIGSIFCAIAPTADILIAFRILKGIGAALMIPGSLAIIAKSYPPEERAQAIGQWASASAITTALGPILGGIALDIIGSSAWRWLFAINLPLGIIAITLLTRHIREDNRDSDRPLDLMGLLVISLSLASLAWGLTELGNGHALAISASLFGLITFLVFLWIEKRSAHPMMPLGLFRSPSFSAANIATFLIYFGMSAVLFFLPMALIGGWGVSQTSISLLYLPITVAIALLSPIMGKLALKYGSDLLIAVGAMIVACAYFLLFIALPFGHFWAGVLPPMMLMGIGMGIVVAPLSASVMGSVGEKSSGIASGVNNAVARISGLLAVALLGGITTAGYKAAGGTESFGIVSETFSSSHAAASASALQVIALIAAAASALGAGAMIISMRMNKKGES